MIGRVTAPRRGWALLSTALATVGAVFAQGPTDSPPPLVGHARTVQAVAWTPDGKTILTAGLDRTIRAWDARTHLQVQQVVSPGGEVRVLAAHPDPSSSLFLSGQIDGTVELWLRQGGGPGRALDAKQGTAVRALATCPTTKHNFASASGKRVQIWDGQVPPQFSPTSEDHAGTITSVAWGAGGDRIASGDDGGQIRLWTDAGQPSGTIQSPSPVDGLAILPDANNLAISAHDDGFARLWRLPLPAAAKLAPAKTTVFAAGANGQKFATADAKSVQPWNSDGSSGTAITLLHNVAALALAQDGGSLAYVADDGSINYLGKAGEKEVAKAATAPSAPVAALRFGDVTPTGGLLAASGQDGKITLYTISDGATFAAVPALLTTATGPVTALAFSPVDGNLLYFADWTNHRVTRWDIAKAKDAHDFTVSNGAKAIGIALSADGLNLAAATDDNQVSIWSLTGTFPILFQKTIASRALSVGLSKDRSQLVAACADGIVRLWDVASGRELEDFVAPGKAARGAAIPSDTGQPLTAWEDGVRVWSPALVGLLDPGDLMAGAALAVAVDTSGKQAVVAYQGNNSVVYDTSSGAAVQTLKGHSKSVRAALFVKDTQVVTGSDDGTIKAWDLTGVGPVQTYPSGTSPIRSLAFQAAGSKLLAGLGDGSTQVFDLSAAVPANAMIQAVGPGPGGTPVTAVAFLQGDARPPEQAVLALGSGGPAVTAWSLVPPAGGPLDSTPPPALPQATLGLSWFPGDVGTPSTTFAAGGLGRTLIVGDIAKMKTPTPSKSGPDPIRAVAASKGVVAAGQGNAITLWKASDATPLGAILGHSNRVNCLDISPDGTVLASGSVDNTVRLWTLPGGAPIAIKFALLPRPDEITAVAFHPAGDRIAAVDKGGTLAVWDRTTGKLRASRPIAPAPTPAAFGLSWSPDGTQIAVASDDHKAYVFAIP